MLLFVAMSIATAQQLFLRTTTVASCQTNDYGVFQDWSEWESARLLIMIDFDNDIVEIDNKYEDVFQLVSVESTETGRDSGDGDPFTKVTCTAIDQNNHACIVMIKKFDSGLYHIMAKYSNFAYTYEAYPIEIE